MSHHFVTIRYKVITFWLVILATLTFDHLTMTVRHTSRVKLLDREAIIVRCYD